MVGVRKMPCKAYRDAVDVFPMKAVFLTSSGLLTVHSGTISRSSADRSQRAAAPLRQKHGDKPQKKRYRRAKSTWLLSDTEEKKASDVRVVLLNPKREAAGLNAFTVKA